MKDVYNNLVLYINSCSKPSDVRFKVDKDAWGNYIIFFTKLHKRLFRKPTYKWTVVGNVYLLERSKLKILHFTSPREAWGKVKLYQKLVDMNFNQKIH